MVEVKKPTILDRLKSLGGRLLDMFFGPVEDSLRIQIRVKGTRLTTTVKYGDGELTPEVFDAILSLTEEIGNVLSGEGSPEIQFEVEEDEAEEVPGREDGEEE